MLGSIYRSLSGMQAFSAGLDVVSNNVANMNTAGFKASDSTFRDLVQQQGGATGNGSADVSAQGAGVEIGNSGLVFSQGDLRSTSNPLDVALNGAGMFVLATNDGQRIYTRSGQFEFNQDGFLVDRETENRVMVNTAALAFGDFNINGYRTFAPRVTSEVTLAGVLARGGTTTTYDLPQITVHDTSGATMQVRVRFTRDATDPLQWSMEVLDTNNAVLGSGNIGFNADGTPAEGANSVSVTITPTNGTPAFTVAFDIGDAGAHNGITSVAGTTTSQVQMLRQNGLALGTITKTEFDERGQIKITYTNGETLTPASLLLARFESAEQLTQLGGSRFALAGTQQPILGTAMGQGFGEVKGSNIEMSNVDLMTQFSELIVLQRGFQGSSQIASAANEMMQHLIAMSSGK